jgi:CubicO group peptidase (beta-lactamase class C family)
MRDQLTSVLRERIADGTIPGAIVTVVEHGQVVHLDAQGVMDSSPDHAFATDTVIWLASLTKPIVAAAILLLVEEDKLRIEDAVASHIPEFGTPPMVRVWKGGPPVMAAPFGPPPDPLPDFELVPAERPITLKDLLTHTSGLQTLGVFNPDLPPIGPTDTLETHVPKVANVALDFQPGSKWGYSNATAFEVLARIVEVAGGQPFPTFLQERIFAPLRMHDTTFGGSRDHARAMPLDPRFSGNPVLEGTTYFSGSAGLWATAEDYCKFATSLLSGTLLQPSSTREMTTNHVGDLMTALNGRGPMRGLAFGLGVAVVEDAAAAGLSLSNDTFGWDGIATRRFWASPREARVLFMYVPNPRVQAEVETAVAAPTG